MDVKKKIGDLPDSAGVYLMKGPNGEIIYIGKAASLKKRVASYFRQRPISGRLQALIGNIKDVEYIATANEAEALLLESGLIKSHHPKYNVALRDDKRYPLLKLTLNEKFPRLFITRMKKDDGARYFGPFTEAKLLRQALGFLRRAFPLRTCRTMPKTACLDYHLRQCLAPCVAKVDTQRYSDIINQLITFLKGKKQGLLKQLEERMAAASKAKRYEEAAGLRDQIRALTSTIAISKKRQDVNGQLAALKEIIRLKQEPRRVEAFDVSNISGKEAVGSMVSFLNGKPYKNGYRKFKIRQVKGIDDYGMMREIVHRRYENLIEQKEPSPDLIIIDGGKGHLSSVKDMLEKLGLENIPVMSIAKEFEHIFLPGKQEPIKLQPNSLVLYLIQRIRDEAHRFAIEYHRRLRGKLISTSGLDSIKGIGPKKKTALIKHFGSVEEIKRSRKVDLLQVKGINKRLAGEIKRVIG